MTHHIKEGLPVNKKVILTEPRRSSKRRGGICDHLHNMIPLHGPGEVQYSGSVGRVMNFVTVREDHAFARCDGPDDCDVVFFSSTCYPGFSGIDCGAIWKAETPVRGQGSAVKNTLIGKSSIQ